MFVLTKRLGRSWRAGAAFRIRGGPISAAILLFAAAFGGYVLAILLGAGR
jgi:hypothetical protein